jgi:solute carrier family 25 (adenine nucleotide translocator) protein 4/5/6/31
VRAPRRRFAACACVFLTRNHHDHHLRYRGVYFGLYDSLRELNPYRSENSLIGIASKFGVAQFTAIAAGYASYPFDTVRRRLQMQSEKPKDQWVYKGTFDCAGKILKEEGMTSLFKGAGANALRTVGSAAVLVLYDSLQTMINPDAKPSSGGG